MAAAAAAAAVAPSHAVKVTAAASVVAPAIAQEVPAATPPPPTPAPLGACAPRLASHPAEWSACRNGSLCLLFLAEPPFIHTGGLDAGADPDSPLYPGRPFPCGEYGSRNLSGLSFGLHATAWPAPTDLCAWAGPDCTFNGMVELLADSRVPGHPGHGMALGAGGLLSFTSRRARLGTSSDSMFEARWGGVGDLVRRESLPARDGDSSCFGNYTMVGFGAARVGWEACFFTLFTDGLSCTTSSSV